MIYINTNEIEKTQRNPTHLSVSDKSAQVDRAKGEYPNLSTLNFIQLLLEVSPQVHAPKCGYLQVLNGTHFF